MYTQIKGGAYVGNTDMPADKRARVDDLILQFETQLQSLVTEHRIPARHIRPLATGSVICGAIDDHIFIAYHPQLGMPTISFLMLQTAAGGRPTLQGFSDFLVDQTAVDFSMVELRESWLGLDEAARTGALKAVAMQVVQNELSRRQASSAMIPFNPVFGPNRFPIQDNLVFVLMPFDEYLTKIYNSVVKPAIESRNLICRRADDIASNNAVMSDIYKSICESKIVVADLTMRNPNVMYELGIAHTVGKETILIHQSAGADAPRSPFDISHFRIIDYKDDAVGGNALRMKLGETVDAVLQKPSSVRNLTDGNLFSTTASR